MVYIVIFLLVILMLYVVMNRRSASLQLVDDKTLVVRTSDKDIRLSADLIDEEELISESVSVTQTLLRDDDGAFLVFERVLTADDHTFDQQDEEQVMRLAFDAKDIQVIYASGTLTFYQVLLTDLAALDVIVCQSDTQAIRLLYGLSDQKLLEIIRAIDPSNTSAVKRSRWEAKRLETLEHAVKTRWDRSGEQIRSCIIPMEPIT